MSTINLGWLKSKSGDRFAPRTLSSQVITSDGTLFEDKIAEDIVVLKDTIDAEINELVNNISNKDHDHVADDITDLQEKFDNTIINISTSDTTNGYAKTYTITQGGSGVGTIDIPKDLVVTNGYVTDNPPDHDPGKYIVLEIANDQDPLYINVGSLVDVYNHEENSEQIQINIDQSSRIISATIVEGSIGTSALTDGSVTMSKVADKSITSDKLSDDLSDELYGIVNNAKAAEDAALAAQEAAEAANEQVSASAATALAAQEAAEAAQLAATGAQDSAEASATAASESQGAALAVQDAAEAAQAAATEAQGKAAASAQSASEAAAELKNAKEYFEGELANVAYISTEENENITFTDEINQQIITAVNAALSNAKASGVFDGSDGKTPTNGVDYFTPTEKNEMIEAVLARIPVGNEVAY